MDLFLQLLDMAIRINKEPFVIPAKARIHFQSEWIPAFVYCCLGIWLMVHAAEWVSRTRAKYWPASINRFLTTTRLEEKQKVFSRHALAPCHAGMQLE
ncbi:MAG TPA: hypothetical protein VMA74_12195 [Dyella sp.]|uniref:hypothetical protein n=1 Tax=Dyella sp. TaxID=1869338 RepID=UPI002C94463C|nr:hypothetical protein [Dyella sp.]HUB90476.1 hypothetical protein [Dyella sp.]